MKTSFLRRPTFLLPLLLAACTVNGRPQEPDPTTGLVEAAREDKAELPTFVGVVTSKVNKAIVAEVDAKLTSIDGLEIGKRVKAGQLLAQQDDQLLKAQLITAKAQASAAAGDAGSQAAQARAAGEKLRVEKILARNGASSRMAVKMAAAERSALSSGAGGAGGRYAAAKNEVAQIETLIGKTQIVSPISGVVTRVKARDGALLAKGQTIAHVFDDSDLRIRFKVDAEYRSLVKVGDRIAFEVEGDQPVIATINYISDELEPPLNFVLAEADLDDGKLSPDQVRVAATGRVSLYDVARKQKIAEDKAKAAAAAQATQQTEQTALR